MEFTVEDVIARPGLRARAKLASQDKAQAAARAFQEQADALRDDVWDFAATTLAATPAELADTEFQMLPYNPETPSFVFVLDGIKLRGRYRRDKLMELKSDTFAKETIYEDVLTVEAFFSNTWKTVTDLASLGKLL